jgi:hypothetical protein
MTEVNVTCSRCQKNIVGTRSDLGTSGYYDVSPTDSPAGWDKFANPGETILCDPCMCTDSRYIKVYGDFNARSLQPQQENEEAARRLARFSIMPELFLVFTSGWFEVIANPLPADVKMVGSFYDEPRHCFTVVLTSEEFAPVPKGALIPDVQPPLLKRIEFKEDKQ